MPELPDIMTYQEALGERIAGHVLEPAEIERLWCACRAVLKTWSDRFREQRKGEFPEKVTAFRPEMAVHGKFGQPCPVCGSPVQRIRYADTETNYCARCQTGGRRDRKSVV